MEINIILVDTRDGIVAQQIDINVDGETIVSFGEHMELSPLSANELLRLGKYNGGQFSLVVGD